jgi:(1->4)-alpha-D-glucan 1-alpha-D-glucosylmutase
MPDDAPRPNEAEATADEARRLLRRVLPRASKKRPVASYRLQLRASFGFREATALVPYLHALGVTTLYASPFLQARPGSAHGYDVVDHGRINAEIGTLEELQTLADALHARGMTMIADVVPNHMGIGRHNGKWIDVLENGPSSIHARFFDVDWSPVKTELEGKILLPILGDQYGAVLERGELQLSFESGAFTLHYHDERLPISPRSMQMILRHGLDALESEVAADDVHLLELLSILTAIDNLPPRDTTLPAKVLERHREKEVVKRRLGALYASSDTVRAHVDRAVHAINGDRADPSSFDALDAVLEEQAYRLAYWRVAGEEINYRRFFDINALAAIRQEDPVVFEETHRIHFQLLRDGVIDGLRIDHPDGLYDPAAYLAQLQEEAVVQAARVELADDAALARIERPLRQAHRAALHDDPRDATLRPLWVVVEKILSRKERVPEDWAIDGTTGYEFLNLLNGLFVARDNVDRIDDAYARAVGCKVDFFELVRRNKKMIMKASMTSEVNVLAHRLSDLSELSRKTRDFTLNSLRHALIEMVACFPIYRTYVRDFVVDDRDVAFIDQAYRAASANTDHVDQQTLDFLRDVLLMKPIFGDDEGAKRDHLAFVMKLQQVTGPVMAKGLEDTTFYVYNRLISLNEVGGEPERFGVTVEGFHKASAARAQRWPHALLTTSTHDTKRSEDVRARIDVVSELPDAWERFLSIAREANESRKVKVGERLAPDAAEEVLLYQTLLGAVPEWPLKPLEKEAIRDRIEQYMLKAVKEAKVNNSWTNHVPEYDRAIVAFIRALLDAPPDDPFHEEMRSLHRKIARVARVHALSATLIKIASPGVPDVYQGTELADLSLVDPDNRRPVDWDARRTMLEELDARGDRAALARELSTSRDDSRAKLFVTATTLRTRREHESLFMDGAYVPLECVGARAKNLIAFARVHEGEVAIVVAPRLVAGILGERRAWEGTFVQLPDVIGDALEGYESMIDAFTDLPRELARREGARALDLARVLHEFPVALLLPGERAPKSERALP